MENKKKVDLSSFNNDHYKPGGIIKIGFWYFFNVFFLLNPWNPFSKLKVLVLRMFGAKIGKGVVIKPSVNIKYPWKLKVGDYVWIGENVWIDNLDTVTLASHSCVSQGAMLLCGNHNYKKSTFDLIVRRITVEEGGWVGAKSIVAPGVVVGSHALLTAGSVATQNLKPYGIYTGNPAEWKKERVMK